MNEQKALETLKQTARNNNVPVEVIIREIEASIADAIETALKENDTDKLKMWNAIPRKGDKPTAVEFIAYMGSAVNQPNDGNYSIFS